MHCKLEVNIWYIATCSTPAEQIEITSMFTIQVMYQILVQNYWPSSRIKSFWVQIVFQKNPLGIYGYL